MHLEASELLRLERASSRDGRTDPGGFGGSPLGWGTDAGDRLAPITQQRVAHCANLARVDDPRLFVPAAHPGLRDGQ